MILTIDPKNIQVGLSDPMFCRFMLLLKDRQNGQVFEPSSGFLMIWVMVSSIYYFHPYLGKIPVLTNIFQLGWNHQLVMGFQNIHDSRWYNFAMLGVWVFENVLKHAFYTPENKRMEPKSVVVCKLFLLFTRG